MTTTDKNAAGSGSYVLHAMDSGERRDFEDELAQSEELRNEVTELADTAVVLGLAVQPVAPPASLKSSIMARIAETPQLARVDEPEPLATVHTLRPSGGSRAATKVAMRWYNRPVVLAASAAAAIVLIVGGVVGTGVITTNVTASQQADALAAINAAPDSQRAEAAISSGGTATLVWSAQLGKSALISTGLKSLPSNKTYELWYINKAGKAASAGLFDTDGSRTISVLSGKMAKGDTVGVTVEPTGGSAQPTTTPIVAIASA